MAEKTVNILNFR